MTPPTAQPQHIWRINAYLILTTCALALALLLAGLARLAWEWRRVRAVGNAVVATEESGHVQRERLSYRLRHTQGDVVVLDVVADQQIEQTLGAKTTSGVMRNQVFVNVADGSSARLLPDDRGLIARVWAVHDDRVVRAYGLEHDERPLPAVRARLYEVVSKDSNGDGRLSASDPRRLLLARADGSAPVTLAEGITRLDAAALDAAAGELRLTAVPTGASSMQLYRFDLSRWAALPPVSLPSLPKEH